MDRRKVKFAVPQPIAGAVLLLFFDIAHLVAAGVAFSGGAGFLPIGLVLCLPKG